MFLADCEKAAPSPSGPGILEKSEKSRLTPGKSCDIFMCTKYILGFYTHAPVEEGRVRFMARKILTYVVIVVVAMLCALNYHLFVFPNR